MYKIRNIFSEEDFEKLGYDYQDKSIEYETTIDFGSYDLEEQISYDLYSISDLYDDNDCGHFILVSDQTDYELRDDDTPDIFQQKIIHISLEDGEYILRKLRNIGISICRMLEEHIEP